MNTHQHTDQQPTAMTDTHKQPFVHLAYRKIMIDHLPLRELARRVKAAEVVLGAPVRVFFARRYVGRVISQCRTVEGARDRQGTLVDLTHGWHELQVEQHPRQRYFPLLDPGETGVIRPEQDVWNHLVLLQPASEGEEEQV